MTHGRKWLQVSFMVLLGSAPSLSCAQSPLPQMTPGTRDFVKAMGVCTHKILLLGLYKPDLISGKQSVELQGTYFDAVFDAVGQAGADQLARERMDNRAAATQFLQTRKADLGAALNETRVECAGAIVRAKASKK
jgi:hypothetical protein